MNATNTSDNPRRRELWLHYYLQRRLKGQTHAVLLTSYRQDAPDDRTHLGMPEPSRKASD